MTATETVQADTAMHSSLVPALMLSDASAAVDFYKRAFGAQEVARIPMQDGKRLMHVHLRVNGADFVFNDAMPEHGRPLQTPQGYSLMLIVDDIDAWWTRAIDAGATGVMPPEKMFWGDRFCELKDPFGVSWTMDEPAQGR